MYHRIDRRHFAISALGLAAASGAEAHATTSAKPAYKDASLSIQARVSDLLGRMTLKEKVAQMQCIWQKKP